MVCKHDGKKKHQEDALTVVTPTTKSHESCCAVHAAHANLGAWRELHAVLQIKLAAVSVKSIPNLMLLAPVDNRQSTTIFVLI